jgi:isopenicillin N synthase-like dioxygenase
MPSATQQPVPLPKWERPAKTTHDLQWANLTAIDLSKFDQPGGKQELAEQLRRAVHQDGFFAVTGSGFTDAEVQRQYEIGQAFFAQEPAEKNKPELRCDFANGNYFGYRAVTELGSMDGRQIQF